MQELKNGKEILTAMLFLMRLCVKALWYVNYFCVLNFFPVLLRSTAFSICQGVARPITALSPLAATHL